MTEMPATLRDLLACPRCHGALRDEQAGGAPSLVCDRCALRFPVDEGIPVLLAERAIPLGQG